MSEIHLYTAKPVVPVIYAYTTPEISRHDGYVKIGMTEKAVDSRINDQIHTPDVEGKIEWVSDAVYNDGTGQTFRDIDFHRYLKKYGVERLPNTEWFKISPDRAEQMLDEFKKHRDFDPNQIKNETESYILRPKQLECINKTADYYKENPSGRFLWNAKPRFGKTLCVYEFCRKVGAQHVLIVTNRPAVVTSWYADYVKFVRGWDEEYYFASDSIQLKKLDGTSYYVSTNSPLLTGSSYFTFVSLQDLKGSIYFGGNYDKLKHIKETHWDVLVIDESHEGVDTFKTDTAFDQLTRDFSLYLSGTPFKALASKEFASNQIFNWTYVDEQYAKTHWDGEGDNPYADMPKLNLYTYRMSDIVRDQIRQGIDIDGNNEEYAFDLNEFFATNEKGHFIHLDAVKQFIKSLTTQKKFPFSTHDLREQLKHSLWLLDRVDSARELAKLLREDPVFENYKIILAAGDNKIDEDDPNQTAFEEVIDNIRGNKLKGIMPADKTITLSVGKLTTGVTIPEWSGVLMLSNIASAALYMQAAFRAQNPWLRLSTDSKNRRVYLRKENAYVFDFDPARTLDLYEDFSNGLYTSTATGYGTLQERQDHIQNLLNFFPVIGEDENGEMVELSTEEVLSVPRKIRSQEVVNRGFMSNFLFQNITNIFGAPKEVIDIINQFPEMKEQKNKKQPEPIPEDVGKDLNLNENGEVSAPEELVLGTAHDIFGDKKYNNEVITAVDSVLLDENSSSQDNIVSNEQAEKLKNDLNDKVVTSIVAQVEGHYGDQVKPSDHNEIVRNIKGKLGSIVDRGFADMQIKVNENEHAKKEELATSTTAEQDELINDKYDHQQDALVSAVMDNIKDEIINATEDSKREAVELVETKILQRKKDTEEDKVRDRLRGFARTIPSFLMAYGKDHDITLETFDKIIPDQVFIDVTSISLSQFRFLRDGGDYISDDGSTKHFAGNLFDPVVFNDSVKEFLRLRKKLSNYFDESQKKDIFDYIPPQKTNQIFTPKRIVREMVDMLEKENPGCFDDPDATFIDLYMKSGMYIAEIVKRLFQSKQMKELYPDDGDRLNHIFAKQVYGCAPTEIIYNICRSFILGFSDDIHIEKDNIKLCDTLKYAKDGTLPNKLEELYHLGD